MTIETFLRTKKFTLFISIIIPIVLRFILFYKLSNETQESIRENVQISTPLTDFKRLKEGIFLYSHGVNPYEGNLYVQSPIFLLIGSLFSSISLNRMNQSSGTWVVSFIWTGVDVFVAYLLFKLGYLQQERDAKEVWKRKLNEDEDEIYQDLLLMAQEQEKLNQEESGKQTNINDDGDDDTGNSTQKQDNGQSNNNQKNKKRGKQIQYKTLSVTELSELFSSQDIIESRLPVLPKVDPLMVSLLYLWNPFVILTCIGKSTIVFNTLCMSLGLYFALKSYKNGVALCLAFATYLSFYPFMLVIPYGMIVYEQESHSRNSNQKNCTGKLNARKSSSSNMSSFFNGTVLSILLLTVVYLVSLLGLSFVMMGSWNFLSSFYGTLFFVHDLQPNIGLYWYFVIEMFDHFRTFFVCVFQMVAFVFTIPTCISFRKDPMVIVFLLSVVMSFMKSYPSLGDVAFTYALLPLFTRLFPYVSSIGPVIALQMGISILMPVFYGLWMSSGAGNANFFYAATLAFGLSQVILVRGFIDGYQRREFDKENLVARLLGLKVIPQD